MAKFQVKISKPLVRYLRKNPKYKKYFLKALDITLKGLRKDIIDYIDAGE